LYLKINREIGRHPLDARHRGEARVISLFNKVKLESSVGTKIPNVARLRQRPFHQNIEKGNLIMQGAKQWIGIDVCKCWLDVHLRPEGKSFRVSNDSRGIAELLTNLSSSSEVGRIILESTGGYERQAALVLSNMGYPVVVINARQGRSFARAANQLAKTDTVDAAILAWFGEAMQPPIRQLVNGIQRELQDLVTRRRQLVDILTTEKNRSSGLRGIAQADIEAHQEWLKERIKQLDEQIEKQINESQTLQTKKNRLESVPGVGKIVSASFLAILPELGKLSTQKISALVGVAPLNRDSGQMKGKRTIFGGRSAIRQMLYMSTLVAVRHNPVIEEFYNKLIKRGKPIKVALVACMHKLLTILNAMIKNGTDWQPVQKPIVSQA
jgi:transposase